MACMSLVASDDHDGSIPFTSLLALAVVVHHRLYCTYLSV